MNSRRFISSLAFLVLLAIVLSFSSASAARLPAPALVQNKILDAIN